MKCCFCVVLVFLVFCKSCHSSMDKPFLEDAFWKRKKGIWQNKKKYFNSLCNEYLFSFLQRFSDEIKMNDDLPIWRKWWCIKTANTSITTTSGNRSFSIFQKIMSRHFEQTSSAPIPEIPDTENIVDRLEHRENNRYGQFFQISLQTTTICFRSLEKLMKSNQISTIEDSVYKIYQLREQYYHSSVESYSISCFCKCAIWARADPSTRILEKWRDFGKYHFKWSRIVPIIFEFLKMKEQPPLRYLANEVFWNISTRCSSDAIFLFLFLCPLKTLVFIVSMMQSLLLDQPLLGARWNQYREFQVTIGRSPNDAQSLIPFGQEETTTNRKRSSWCRRNLNKIGLCWEKEQLIQWLAPLLLRFVPYAIVKSFGSFCEEGRIASVETEFSPSRKRFQDEQPNEFLPKVPLLPVRKGFRNGFFILELAIARHIAKSAPGSSVLSPPTTFAKTSREERRIPACFRVRRSNRKAC